MINPNQRDQLIDAYVAFIPLVTLNVIWFLASLPLITIIPATGGLMYATNRLAHGAPADWRTFLEGFRLHFWRSWAIGLANILLIAVIVANFVFYARDDSAWLLFARVIVILMSAFWLMIQIYMFPLLMEQVQPHLRLALRNSLVIIIRRPLFTLATLVVIGTLAVISTFIIQPAWIFISASGCAFLANLATLKALAKITGKSTVPSD